MGFGIRAYGRRVRLKAGSRSAAGRNAAGKIEGVGMGRRNCWFVMLGLILSLAGASVAQQKPEEIPDAPSASRPIPPPAPPSPRPGADEENTPPAPSPDDSG